MTRRRRYITIAISVTAVAAFLLWYLYPVLLYTLSMGGHEELQRRLDAEPIRITTHSPPAPDWQELSIDTLHIRLPLFELPIVQSIAAGHIEFRGGNKRLIFADIVFGEPLMKQIDAGNLAYPLTPYQQRVDWLSSTSDDLSLFNSRSENMRGLVNQTLKLMFYGGDGKRVSLVTFTELKAVVLFSESAGKSYSATAYVYSRDGAASLTVMMLSYTSEAELEADLLHILSGLRMYQTMPDPQRVTDDIGALVAASEAGQ